MYQIAPYDLSESFKLIPFGEKYQLTFWHENTVKFKCKRKAFDFISKISQFFNEVLQLCELIHSNNNLYQFQIAAKSKANADKFKIYQDNNSEITGLIRDLKFFQNQKAELYQITKKFDNLIFYIKENTAILYKKLQREISANLVLINNLSASFNHILRNAAMFYEQNRLTIFNH